VVLATDHDGFDYELLQSQAQLIVDTRGRLPRSERIIPA
jgi:UDP-N-acetyl-D-glucosamine dehydrogenase